MNALKLLLLASVLIAPTHAIAAAKKSVTVPIDLGIGPAAYYVSGPVARDQPLHYGLKISLKAVIDRDTIAKNANRIPAQYRKLAKSMDEVRISPSLLIPDSLIISPRYDNTGMYGVTWRPFGLSVPLTRGTFKLTLGAGVLLTYAYLFSDTLPNTHFLRPGLDLGARAEVALSRGFLVSLGWSSGFYVPERLGDITAISPLEDSMWHLGQAYLQFHFRFPYSTRL